jgi:phosphohistidine phosphatase
VHGKRLARETPADHDARVKLYFLRHAEAIDGADDDRRPLSPHGCEQAEELGKFLGKAEVLFDAAYTSPLVRARETARLVLDAIDSASRVRAERVDALRNETSQADFEGWLARLPDARRILLVGHEPTLSARVRAMLGMSRVKAFEFSKGAVVCVDTADRRTGSLKLLITPKVLGL